MRNHDVKGIIFDPTCGSGGMFVQCQKFITAHKGKKEDVSIYGQEVIDGICTAKPQLFLLVVQLTPKDSLQE